jgi:hypothetical protein
VDVAIKEARKDRQSRQLNRYVAVESASHVDDPALLDDEIGDGRVSAATVEDTRAGEHSSRHRPDATVMAPVVCRWPQHRSADHRRNDERAAGTGVPQASAAARSP